MPLERWRCAEQAGKNRHAANSPCRFFIHALMKRALLGSRLRVQLGRAFLEQHLRLPRQVPCQPQHVVEVFTALLVVPPGAVAVAGPQQGAQLRQGVFKAVCCAGATGRRGGAGAGAGGAWRCRRGGPGYSSLSHWVCVFFRSCCTSGGQTAGVFVRPGRRLLCLAFCIGADAPTGRCKAMRLGGWDNCSVGCLLARWAGF